jgi:3-(3-hydroxy-phenyl)propionate hydroxylase
MVQQNTQVLIVGAGPVGLLAANLLGGRGVETLVLEREDEPHTYPRAVGLYDDALRAFQMIGLAEQQMADMRFDLGLEVLSGSGRPLIKLDAVSQEQRFSLPPGGTMLQTIIERNLRQGLKRFGQVELRTLHCVERLSQDPGGVNVTVRGPNGSSYVVRARYVFGCDGGRSTTRRESGIALAGSTAKAPWAVIDTRSGIPSGGIGKLIADPVRPIITIPLPHGYHRWEFRLLPGEDPDRAIREESVRAILSPWMGHGDHEIVRCRVYVHHTRLAERFRDRRIFLLGDAAHLMPPFGAQGLGAGIRDAVNLSWKVAMVLNGKAGTGLLSSYEEERRPHVRETQMGVKAFGMIVSPNRLTAILNGVIFETLNKIPPIRRRMQDAQLQTPNRFRRGFFLPGGPAGDMIIQPRVRSVHGKQVLLDDVLGGGFAVVGMDGDPRRFMDASAARFWDEFGARFIEVAPAGRGALGSEGSPEGAPGELGGTRVLVQDESGKLGAWFSQYRGGRGGRGDVAVIRPDLYVAALFPARGANTATAALQRLLFAS